MTFSASSHPSELIKVLKANKINRIFLVFDAASKSIRASHAEVLKPLVEFLQNDKVDYDQHEGMFFQLFNDSLMGVFVWKTCRGQGCGGIRLRSYDTLEEYMRDGMRLAIGMGRKNALAGLYWGGGKGVICNDALDVKNSVLRRELFESYGEFLTSLRGMYVAAEDAGVTVADVDIVFSKTRFTTCISPQLGGSGNPSIPTARGIVAGMEGAVHFASGGKESLEKKSIAIMGCGNVGHALIGFLLEKNVSKIIAVDISADRVNRAIEAYEAAAKKQGIELLIKVDTSTFIYKQDVDILSPCAYGGCLNETTVPLIKARIICGAANNQLLDPSTDYGMTKNGKIYCPDYLVNRMGIVNCANEQYGVVGGGGLSDPIVSMHLDREYENGIFQVLQRVLQYAKDNNTTTAVASDILANEAVKQLHPIFGHRSQRIIDSLIKDEWHNS